MLAGAHGPVAGLVLAGGRSSRLGGGDKPMRLVGGSPMLTRVLQRLSPQAQPLAISANGDAARFAAYGLPVLPDDGPAGQAGPLAGILSGLRWARRETGAAALLTVAGDTPFFPADLAAGLSNAAAGSSGRIAVASSGGRRHPVFGLWPLSIEADLGRFLAASPTFSVSAFLDRHDVVFAEFPFFQAAGEDIDPFFNVNTPDDLARAETIRGRLP